MGTRSEQDYVNLLRRRWPRGEDASLEVLGIADEAVAAFPHSTSLWCMRAALIQLGSGDAPYTLDEALASYQRALAADPSSVEALEDIAHFYDAVRGDSEKAATYFAQAKQARSNAGTKHE